MTLTEARKLYAGDSVQCPADRGDKPYTGTVVSVGLTVQVNVRGSEYLTVEVLTPYGHKVVWPSHRLGK